MIKPVIFTQYAVRILEHAVPNYLVRFTDLLFLILSNLKKNDKGQISAKMEA